MDKPIDIEKVFRESEYIMTTAQLNDAKILRIEKRVKDLIGVWI